MFDVPLPMPEPTAYTSLGVNPDATQEEIQAALGDAKQRLTSEQLAVERELQAVYAQVEGLREAYQVRDELSAADAEPDQLRQAARRVSRLEQRALAVEPRFRTLRERLKRIGDQLGQLGAVVIQRADSRAEYDQGHPPLALLKLEDASRDAFATDARLLGTLLRRELAAFLRRKGQDVHHPTDLTRRDFTADFTYTPLLDGR